MSSGWAWWVIGLIILNLGLTFFLFLWAPYARVPSLADGTTGHVWAHGALREGMQRLPKWWLVVSWAMYLSAFVYLVLYPGFGNFKGILGWTSHGELAAATAANDAKLDPVLKRLSTMSVEALAGDAQAQQLGERLFVDNCAACHGRTGIGNPLIGAPDLADADWLYGNTAEEITASIRDGRSGMMPPWNALGEPVVVQLAQYVLALSGRPHDQAAAETARPVFESTCSACHAADGTGNPALGAPNLTDDVWLYGGSQAAIETAIRDGRSGHMPAWSPRLSDSDIHILAGYVHHLSAGNGASSR